MKMKLPTLNHTAEFVGVTKPTLNNWKKPQETQGIKFHPPFGKNNLYKGARLITYLCSYDYQKGDEAAVNNFELIKSAVEQLKKCCNEELMKPLVEFVEAVEKIENELRSF